MNIAYSRTTNQSIEETRDKLVSLAKERGFEVQEPITIAGKKGVLVFMYKQEWIDNLLSSHPKLAGLFPWAAVIRTTDKETTLNIGNPSLMRAAGHIHELEDLLPKVEKELTSLVNDAAGVEALKPTGIKLYATAQCPYCKQEKDYLEKHDIDFDYILVDSDQEAAKEMVQKTGQMGVPVTEVSFSDADPEYIIGFDKPRIASLLGIEE